jgi:hypothetical protein
MMQPKYCADSHPTCLAFSITETTFEWFWTCLYPNASSEDVIGRNDVFARMMHRAGEVLNIVKHIHRGLGVLCETIGTTQHNIVMGNIESKIILIRPYIMALNSDALLPALDFIE